MSAGMRKPQEWPRLEEKFSQVFVIMLSAMKPGVYQVEDELEAPGQGEGFSPFCWRARSRKRCSISRLPPVWSEMKLGACCAACCQGQSRTAGVQLPSQPAWVMKVVLETASRMGLGVPPPVPWSDLHGHCSGGEQSSHHSPHPSNAVPRCCGSADYSFGR